jgi:hypothetical protein
MSLKRNANRKIFLEALLITKTITNSSNNEVSKRFIKFFGPEFMNSVVLPLILVKLLLEYIDIDEHVGLLFIDDIPKKLMNTLLKTNHFSHYYYNNDMGGVHYSEIPQSEGGNLFNTGLIPYRIINPFYPTIHPTKQITNYSNSNHIYNHGQGIYASRFYPSILYYRSENRPCVDIKAGFRYKWIVYTNELGLLDRNPDEGPALYAYYANDYFGSPYYTNEHKYYDTITITIYAKNGLLQTPKNQEAAFHQEIKLNNKLMENEFLNHDVSKHIYIWAENGFPGRIPEFSHLPSVIIEPMKSGYEIKEKWVSGVYQGNAFAQYIMKYTTVSSLMNFAFQYISKQHITFTHSDHLIKFNPHPLKTNTKNSTNNNTNNIDYFTPRILFPNTDEIDRIDDDLYNDD